MPIRVLSKLLVNQIAAGEVVDRPASVVKELIENSLDAGATRVDVAIEDGGRRLIRISDNGTGITREDLPLAIEPHATSKLQSSEQLARIGTLGFRGEAVASIASVSRLTLSSRATVGGRPEDGGYWLKVEGDERTEVEPWAGNPGTVVEVRDLFFNTPARRKFLRAAATEFGQISDMFARLAMAHPQVGFTLSHNGRSTANWPAATSFRERCLAVLGEELADSLLEFEEEQPVNLNGRGWDAGEPDSQTPMKRGRVWGLAGLPVIARATAKFQYLFVNGRPIRDRGISHAFREAYRGLLPQDRQPVMVVMLDLDARQVDVNVHPTKAEVRFRDPSGMHGLVLGAIRRRLLMTDLTPDAKVGLPTDAWENLGPNRISPEDGSGGDDADSGNGGGDGGRSSGLTDRAAGAGPSGAGRYEGFAGSMERSGFGDGPGREPGDRFAGESRSRQGTSGGTGSSGGVGGSEGSKGEDSFVAYFKRMAPQQQRFVYEDVKRAMAEAGHEVGDTSEPLLAGSEERSEQQGGQGSGEEKTASEHGGGEKPVGSGRPVSILQVHQSYIVTQDEQGIVIVDQHALHERVMFEELSRRVIGAGRALESQRLLMPEPVKVGSRRMGLIEELGPLLERLGIDATPMGPDTVGVHGFPTFLFDRHVGIEEFLLELLDMAEEGRLEADGDTAMEASLHRVLDMMSCKAAVKAGDKLTHDELAALLARRDEIERSSNCPHGRPTQIRLSLKELERQFGRS